LQDDLAKFVSELASPLQLVEVLEEGKANTKERHEVGEGDDTIVVEDTFDEDAMRRRCRSASSCGRGLAALDCLIFLSFRIHRLA
jgi:hypothetical protein